MSRAPVTSAESQHYIDTGELPQRVATITAVERLADAKAQIDEWCHNSDCGAPIFLICEVILSAIDAALAAIPTPSLLDRFRPKPTVYVLHVEQPDWTRTVTVHASREQAEAVVRAIYLTLSSPRFAALDAALAHDVIVERLVGDHGYTITIDACPAPEPGQ